MTTPQLATARGLYDTLAAEGDGTGSDGTISRTALDAIEQADLNGLLVPEEAGGKGLPLTDVVDIYEEISRADGSIGWCHFAADVTATFFGAYLDDDGVAEVFADGVPLMAGQFAPNGTAALAGDDLIVSGDYQFGSGIDHADWAGAGVFTTPTDGSDPEFLFVSLPVAEAELKGNWDVLGLQATASYDYRLSEVRVPRRRSFDFFNPTVHRGGPRYVLGVLPLTAAGHSGWALGVTRRVLDELAAAATATRMGAASPLGESERFLFELGQLEGRYRAGRAWVHEIVAEAEAEAHATGSITARTANLVREACRHVNQGGADIARQAYLLAGTRALRDGPLQRAFRDLHAGSQHFFASPSAAIDLARTLLAGGATGS